MIDRAPSEPFHEELEAIRKRSGLSYELVAERAGTTSSYVFRICKGSSHPNRDLVFRLCLALNLDVNEADHLLRASGHLGLLDSSPHGRTDPSHRAERAFASR